MNRDLEPSSGDSATAGAAALGPADLLVKAQQLAARWLQQAWRAHLVRAMLWRRKKVNLRAISPIARACEGT